MLEPQLARDGALQHAVRGLRGRPASAAATPSSPSTDTKTRARRRSGAVSTAVTVTNPTRGSLSLRVIASDRTSRTASSTRRMRSPVTLAPPGRSTRPGAARTRTPCGKRASSARSTASAASSQRPRPSRPRAPRRASSAARSPGGRPRPRTRRRRCRRSALTRLSSARLAFNEPLSGKWRWTRRSTTNAGRRHGAATRACARPASCRRPRSRRPPRCRRSSRSTMPHSNPAATSRTSSLKRRSDSIVAVVDDRAVADQAALRAARDLAVGDVAAGDRADARGAEDLRAPRRCRRTPRPPPAPACPAWRRAARRSRGRSPSRCGSRRPRGPRAARASPTGRTLKPSTIASEAAARMMSDSVMPPTPAQHDRDLDLLLRQLGDLVLERLERARHVGLEHEVEVLDRRRARARRSSRATRLLPRAARLRLAS